MLVMAAALPAPSHTLLFDADEVDDRRLRRDWVPRPGSTAVVTFDRIAVPAVPLMATVPVASAAGSAVDPPLPAACCTR